MRILVLGGDGYLGWPTAMYFANRGHQVAVLDNFAKRQWELELGVESLFPIQTLHGRTALFGELTGHEISVYPADLTNYRQVAQVLSEFQPEALVHYGEQPAAPYSMIDVHHAVFTQTNNVMGNLNVLWAMRDIIPDAHLVKIGTMGEYGTPNIDIEEGYITIEHKGRTDTVPFPKQPGSFYHLSKVHDSHNILFATKVWGLRATDLNQGVVYGVDSDESAIDPGLATSFHYDGVFGTVLNRFVCQAVAGVPLTVYGKGGQKRGFLNIRDTLQCVELAVLTPAKAGEMRVFNQFTELFNVRDLADLVAKQARALGFDAQWESVPNPRLEAEDHYYNPTLSKLPELGLEPRMLSEELVATMINKVAAHRDRIRRNTISAQVTWRR